MRQKLHQNPMQPSDKSRLSILCLSKGAGTNPNRPDQNQRLDFYTLGSVAGRGEGTNQATCIPSTMYRVRTSNPLNPAVRSRLLTARSIGKTVSVRPGKPNCIMYVLQITTGVDLFQPIIICILYSLRLVQTDCARDESGLLDPVSKTDRMSMAVLPGF